MSKPKLVVADDHPIILEGLRRVLESEFDISGIAANGREVLDMVDRLQPDAVVLDIGLPLLNGIEIARKLKNRTPKVRIIFLTQQDDRAYVKAAFEANASAYLLKQDISADLVTALREALAGHFFVSPRLAKRMPMTLTSPAQNPAFQFDQNLTPRQREVLQLVAEGKSLKEIGSILGISMKTVEFHKAAIMDELGLRSTAELTRYAVEHGIVTSGPVAAPTEGGL